MIPAPKSYLLCCCVCIEITYFKFLVLSFSKQGGAKVIALGEEEATAEGVVHEVVDEVGADVHDDKMKDKEGGRGGRWGQKKAAEEAGPHWVGQPDNQSGPLGLE